MTILANILTVIVQSATINFLSPLGLPVLLFPFNLVSWIFCLAGQNMKGIFPVDLKTITVPENHIKSILLVQKLTSKFK